MIRARVLSKIVGQTSRKITNSGGLLMHSKNGMQWVQPADRKECPQSEKRSKFVVSDLQVARDGRAPLDLWITAEIPNSFSIPFAKSSHIDIPNWTSIIQQEIEHRLCVKDRGILDGPRIISLKVRYRRSKFWVVLINNCVHECRSLRSLYKREGSSVCRWDRQKEEGPCTNWDELVKLVRDVLLGVQRQTTMDAYLSCQMVHKRRIEVWTCYVSLSSPL